MVAAQLPTPPAPTTITKAFRILESPSSPKKALFRANCSRISSSSYSPLLARLIMLLSFAVMISIASPPIELSLWISVGGTEEASFLMEESVCSRRSDWMEKIVRAVSDEEANAIKMNFAVGPFRRLSMESIDSKNLRDPSLAVRHQIFWRSRRSKRSLCRSDRIATS